MKPESRLEIAERNVAEAEVAVARQMQLIRELEADGHPTKGSRIFLGLLEKALVNSREALGLMKDRRARP